MASESTRKQTRFRTKIGRIKCETARIVLNREFVEISRVRKGTNLKPKQSRLEDKHVPLRHSLWPFRSPSTIISPSFLVVSLSHCFLWPSHSLSTTISSLSSVTSPLLIGYSHFLVALYIVFV